MSYIISLGNHTLSKQVNQLPHIASNLSIYTRIDITEITVHTPNKTTPEEYTLYINYTDGTRDNLPVELLSNPESRHNFHRTYIQSPGINFRRRIIDNISVEPEPSSDTIFEMGISFDLN